MSKTDKIWENKFCMFMKALCIMLFGALCMILVQKFFHIYPSGTEDFFVERLSGTLQTQNGDDVTIFTLKQNIIELQKTKKYLQKQVEDLSGRINKLNREIDSLKAVTPPTDKQISEIINQTPKAIIQGIDPKQLRPMVKSVLTYLGEKDDKWVDLLLITSQVESDLGRSVKQRKGPAVGIFQVEPFTEKEVWKHYIYRNKGLKEKITKLRFPAKLNRHEMEYNMAYSIALTYSIYKWRKVNPKNMTLADMAYTHKMKYNTMKGKSTVSKTIQKLAGTNIL